VAFDKDNPSDAVTGLEQALSDMRDDGTLAQILETYGIIADSTLLEYYCWR
jgi:ABC-type amino acid transport substrate-binding protein